MPRPVWITRDRAPTATDYNIYFERPRKDYLSKEGYWKVPDDYFCANLFMPITGFCLKPGEGPVKVIIKLAKVKIKVERRN